MTSKPHKIMTPEEYAALKIIGWHRVCKNVDGMGAVGIQFEGEPQPWDSPHNRHFEPVERRARRIYGTFAYGGMGKKPAWVPHGNSDKQDEARVMARQELRAAGLTTARLKHRPLGSPKLAARHYRINREVMT